MIDDNKKLFAWLKERSEQHWETTLINDGIYGFQIQAGTKWLPGLTDAEIEEFEQIMGFQFPQIYRDYLHCMNGTDQSTVNVYASPSHSFAYDVGYYSYPRDVARIKDLIAWIYKSFQIDEEFVRANQISHILPIVSHRFLLIDNCSTNPVLSMYGKM